MSSSSSLGHDIGPITAKVNVFVPPAHATSLQRTVGGAPPASYISTRAREKEREEGREREVPKFVSNSGNTQRKDRAYGTDKESGSVPTAQGS